MSEKTEEVLSKDPKVTLERIGKTLGQVCFNDNTYQLTPQNLRRLRELVRTDSHGHVILRTRYAQSGLFDLKIAPNCEEWELKRALVLIEQLLRKSCPHCEDHVEDYKLERELSPEEP